MHAHLELLTGILRVYDEGKSFAEKEEFNWACTVQAVGNEIRFTGVRSPPTFEQVTAMRQAAKAAGYEYATWERWNGGKMRVVRVRV